MRNVVVTDPPRADAGDAQTLGAIGYIARAGVDPPAALSQCLC